MDERQAYAACEGNWTDGVRVVSGESSDNVQQLAMPMGIGLDGDTLHGLHLGLRCVSRAVWHFGFRRTITNLCFGEFGIFHYCLVVVKMKIMMKCSDENTILYQYYELT